MRRTDPWNKCQQATYRTLVAAAWAAHAAGTGAGLKDKVAKEQWYREVLRDALGIWTTKQCNQDDFAKACAAFEVLDPNGGTKWQEKALGGDHAEQKRRALHSIRELCAKYEVGEEYAQAIAKHALSLDTLPELGALSPAQLITILRALKLQIARAMQRAA